MGRRHEPRMTMRLPVTVSGVDVAGQPFTLPANVSEVSNLGARLEGVGRLRAGATITVAYRKNQGQFRIVWLGQPGTQWEGQIGLENLDPAKHVFGIGWPPEAPDTYQVPGSELGDSAHRGKPVPDHRPADRRQQERRRFPRYSCVETVKVRKVGSDVPLWGKLTDISLGGCYIEMMSPFPTETAVTMALKVGQFEFRVDGLVAVMHPAMGMGITFTEIGAEDKKLLQRAISCLAGETKELDEMSGNGSIDAHKSITSLHSWFATQDTLTRDQFHSLLQKSSGHSCEEGDVASNGATAGPPSVFTEEHSGRGVYENRE